ncbi:DUF1674 domain-containing protein [Xanthobacter sp. TB0139]|uniref:DUF1674 domain-containing protein n=1 Tax=Xanthobacter sp. TB0139 TaxID=3459178 RepID=UPI0040391DBC
MSETSSPTSTTPSISGAARKPLSEAAKRALAEAEARRAQIDAAVRERPRELNGRDGPEPVRYGDWEVGGIASDF